MVGTIFRIPLESFNGLETSKPQNKVPIPTLHRLATLYKVLREAEARGDTFVDSQELEMRTGISATQIRKDLSLVKLTGKPGVGYEVELLRKQIAHFLKIDRTLQFALIGVGNLGQALASYPGFEEYNFRLTALFDNDPQKIGKAINGFVIEDANLLPHRLRELNIKVVAITVPAQSAQEVAEAAIRGGAYWILNFTPTHLKVPEGCFVRDVSFTHEFAIMAYFVEREK